MSTPKIPQPDTPSAMTRFLGLVAKVSQGTTARSENDLSSNFAAVLGSLGLHTVIDSSVATSGRKRPDILGYVSPDDADLVLPADVVVESKKPQELEAFTSMQDALVSEMLWSDKTVAYIRSNIVRIKFFILTTFTEFGIVTITPSLRLLFIGHTRNSNDDVVKQEVRKNTITFDLASGLADSNPHSSRSWQNWLNDHLAPQSLAPVSVSTIHNSFAIRNRADLDGFATRLADVAAGATDGKLTNAGLFYSVRSQLPSSYQGLPPHVQRDLHIFLMTQHPGMTSAGVATIAKDNPQEVIADFVAASIHSLVGRLFAFKAVEDVFCIREAQPLIEQDLWIFASDRYDGKPPELLRTDVFHAIRKLRTSKTAAIQQFAVYGFFFDWIEGYIDPCLFRSLFEMFVTNDFESVEGDLLGRFFEIYSQKVNRTKRKALGQYYTPQTIVEFVWHLALGLVRDRGAKDEIQVLDPSMGSGTFLTQGARLLAEEGIPHFWERLTGFDISAQVLGIAYVNFYVSILSHLSRLEAGNVGDLRVYATDTLDPRNGKYLKEILPLIPDPDYKHFIEQRIKLSSEIKQKGHFNLVIGNPPYRNNSSLVLSQVASVFPRLLASSVAAARAQERNPRDDYAWFFAAADHYVQDRGLIAYIVSDSFAQNQSYRYFRSDLLRYYYVRHLLRLGEQVFQDVGPRISFVVVVLEKRMNVLESPDDGEPHPYTDLRHLASAVHPSLLGGDDDPRFSLMSAIVKGEAPLPVPEQHKPGRATGYSLYPATNVTEIVAAGSIPVFAKGATRIYNEKWPGLITAFDDLLKSKDEARLGVRIASFFTLAHERGLSSAALQPAIESWGREHAIASENFSRLELLATQINQKNIEYSASNIKRTLDGAMPNTDRWYPPKRNTTFIYYETALDIPRNANEGKSVGWGSMQQWREPDSHKILPKLVYTSASKARYGLKAFVLSDEWHVKIHGGTSQQYNYTGISYPGRTQRMDGLPNNLTTEGLEILAGLTEQGLAVEDINFYVASLYNSSLAAEFLEQAGSGTTFSIKKPSNEQMFRLAASLAKAGRRARDLTWLSMMLDSQESIAAPTLESLFYPAFLSEVGLVRAASVSTRFRAEHAYTVGSQVAEKIGESLSNLQTEIDDLTVDIYS